MNSIPREKLQYIITHFGRSLVDDPRRCEALLRDLCPAHKRELNVLLAALREQVPHDLLQTGPARPIELTVPRLIQRLEEDVALAPAAAHWAVGSWALALGLMSEQTFSERFSTGPGVGKAPAPEPPRTDAPPQSDRVVLPSLAPEGLTEFAFETVRVNERGQIIERIPGRARQKVFTLPGNVPLELVHIPGGSFMMGAPAEEKDSYDDERPQHRVTIQPFFMGKYAVTQPQWQAVMGQNPAHFKGANRPVEKVSWNDAQAFMERLAKSLGFGKSAFRLPSEAEWEFACRAGTTTPFAFGPTITPELVNYNGNYPYGNAAKGKCRWETTPVGSFPPNGLGLFDMHGNVWEWCQDKWHNSYQGAPADGGARESGDSSYRVLRGGYWFNDGRRCRSAIRNNFSPGYRRRFIGCRLVFVP